MTAPAFPADYAASRRRFGAAALKAGARLAEYPIAARGPGGEALAMDVATLGAAGARRVLVLSSGMHGVEAPAGSAIQSAWLESLGEGRARLPGESLRVVLVHALNPYGHAWRRRANENNVDLNRNFLLPGEAYSGAPPTLRALQPFIAPGAPPAPAALAWLYWPRAALLVARHGMSTLQEALTQGQHEFPGGLFYGGHCAEESTRIVQREFVHWIAPGEAALPESVLHLDLHTGLGRYGHLTLLANQPPAAPATRWLDERFSPMGAVQSAGTGLAAEAAVRGGMGRWLEHSLEVPRYVFATAEFGTYSGMRVFGALRDENRAHAHPGHPSHARARRRLQEAFCPEDCRWRTRVMEQGLALIARATDVVS